MLKNKFVMSSGKLLVLSFFSFLFIASFALYSTRLPGKGSKKAVVTRSQPVQESFPPVPVLKDNFAAPDLTAESILALDVDSGVSLYEKNPDERLFPASTTKMITALTALDYYPLDKVVTVGKVSVDGQKMNLHQGEELTAGDLIKGLLIYSANDAAEVLAQNYCDPVDETDCGRSVFINAMNNKAARLHLDNSKFFNPSGLDAEGHLTTARDLSRIAEAGLKNAFFREVVSTKMATVESIDGKFKHKLTNLNTLLGEVNGVLGIKTGWTENAKENLVTYIDRDDHRVVIVLLRSDDRFGETKQLIDWIFGNYVWKTVKI